MSEEPIVLTKGPIKLIVDEVVATGFKAHARLTTSKRRFVPIYTQAEMDTIRLRVEEDLANFLREQHKEQLKKWEYIQRQIDAYIAWHGER
jgi:hypothetical protein